MMAEIHGLRFLERDQGYMIAWRKIDSVIAYSMLKQSEINEISMEDIGKFLTTNGYQPTQDDLEGIFRRLDHNKDGKITYSDFSQMYDDTVAERLEMLPSHRSEAQEPSLCWGSPLRKSPNQSHHSVAAMSSAK